MANNIQLLYTQWNVDSNGNKISVQIPNEQHQVVEGKILLTQIPDEFYRLNISNYVEIPKAQAITSANQYKVDYVTGLVFFHSSKEGSTITINQYYGRGIVYIDATRIATLTNGATVLQTLKELTDDTNVVLNEANEHIETMSQIEVFEPFDALKTYKPLNKVTFFDSSYLNIQECTGIYPYDTQYWIKISSRGSDGYSSVVPNTVPIVANNQTNIPTGFTDFDPTNGDQLRVRYGQYKTLLEDGENYSLDSDNESINLINWSANAGDIFYFEMLKNLNADNIQLANDAKDIVLGYQFKGDYNPSENYIKNNLVYYNGGTYINKVPCTNILPSNETNWFKLARHGNDGLGSMDRVVVTIGSDNTTHIVHNLNYDPAHDILEVVDVTYGTEYITEYTENVDNISIDLVGFSLNSGRKVLFKLFKGMNDATLQALVDDAIIEKNALNTLIPQAETKKTELQNVINTADTTTYATVGNMGNKTNLNTNDKSNLVNAINETNNKLGDLSTLGVESTVEKFQQVDESLAERATKQDVANMGSASPKGAYATLSALQSAFPTGATGIYVVAADGKWYFWNGSAWTAGGQYQSTGISDNGVTEGNLRYQSFGFGQLSDLTEQLSLPVSIKDFVGNGCTLSFVNSLELKATTISGTSVTWQSILTPYKKASFTLLKAEYVIIGKNATEKIAICLLNNNYGKLFKFTDTTFSTVTISDFPAQSITYFNSHKVEVSVNGNIVDIYYYNDSNVKTLLYSFNINNYFSANYTGAIGFVSHATTNTSGNLARFYNESKSITKNDVYIKSEIDTMFSQQWAGKAGNALGDSITEQGTYLPHVITALGLASYTNYGQSGTMIAKQTESSTTAFCVRYSDMADNVDLVTVFGGTNDYGNSIELGTKNSTELTTFYGALKALCAGLVAKYPTKRIFFFTPLQRDWQGGGQVAGVGANAKGYTLLDYCNAIKTVCADYGIPVLDLYSTSGITIGNITNWTSDRLHINVSGGARVGMQAGIFIKQYSL